MSDSELKAILAKLADKIDDERGENARERAENARERAQNAKERAENAKFRDEVRADIATLKTGVAVLSARLDEQRSILAAMVPTRLAAIPAAPDERRVS